MLTSNPLTLSSLVALGVGFGFPSIGRQAVLPTHNENNAPQLYQQQGFLSLETGNYSTPNPTEVRLKQVIPRAGPLPCVSVTSSYGATKSLSRPCIPFELLFPRRVIFSGASLHLVWCCWVSGQSCAPLFAPLLGFCLTSCDM